LFLKRKERVLFLAGFSAATGGLQALCLPEEPVILVDSLLRLSPQLGKVLWHEEQHLKAWRKYSGRAWLYRLHCFYFHLFVDAQNRTRLLLWLQIVFAVAVAGAYILFLI